MGITQYVSKGVFTAVSWPTQGIAFMHIQTLLTNYGNSWPVQCHLKVPLTCKIFILLNEAVPRVKTDGDTKSRYTYVQIAKNPQLLVAVPLKISHFCDDVTRGTGR